MLDDKAPLQESVVILRQLEAGVRETHTELPHLVWIEPHLRHPEQAPIEAMQPGQVLPARAMNEVGTIERGVECALGFAAGLVAPVEFHALVPFALVKHPEPRRHAIAEGVVGAGTHPLHAVPIHEAWRILLERALHDYLFATAAQDVG